MLKLIVGRPIGVAFIWSSLSNADVPGCKKTMVSHVDFFELGEPKVSRRRLRWPTMITGVSHTACPSSLRDGQTDLSRGPRHGTALPLTRLLPTRRSERPDAQPALSIIERAAASSSTAGRVDPWSPDSPRVVATRG